MQNRTKKATSKHVFNVSPSESRFSDDCDVSTSNLLSLLLIETVDDETAELTTNGLLSTIGLTVPREFEYLGETRPFRRTWKKIRIIKKSSKHLLFKKKG